LDATFARDNTTKGFFMFQACLVGNLGGVSHCLTVARTVVLRNSVVWWTGWNAALWLVENSHFCMCPVWNSKAMEFRLANHIVVFQPVLVYQTMEFRQPTARVTVGEPSQW